MSLINIILISISLAMDAFVVSMAKGTEVKYKDIPKIAFILALFFGLFQAIMPILGYFFAETIFEKISFNFKIIGFIIFLIIGIKMLVESFKEIKEEKKPLDFKEIIALAVATSIDALAIGISFIALDVNIFTSALIIGLVTYILSFIGVYLGNKIGLRLGKGVSLFGAILLILLAFKTFLF